jgi:hypothetical protein
MYEHHVNDETRESQPCSNTAVGGYEIANSVLDAAGFNRFQQCIVLPAATVDRIVDAGRGVWPCLA